MKTQPLKVDFEDKDHADDIWLSLVKKETSHEFAASFLRRRCGYPDQKARSSVGARPNIFKGWDESDHPRDESGRFSDGDGSGSNHSGVYERITPSHVEGFDRDVFEQTFPGTDPRDFLEALLGPDADPRFVEVSNYGGKYSLTVREGGTVHGHEIEFYQRDFYPKDGVVVHEYLIFKEQGAGNAKDMFRSAVDLYDKMGVKEIRVHAALELGAYTWSKYGFRYGDAADRLAHVNGFEGDSATNLRERLDELVPSSEVQRMSSEEYEEYKALKLLLNVQDDRLNQLLSDFETPELDKLVSHLSEEKLDKGSSFIKHLFYKTHWTGLLDLDKNSPDRKRLEAYLRAKSKLRAKKILDKLASAWQNWTMKTAKKPPKGFSSRVGKKYSDKEIMLTLLGDEPDVSKSSRDLATKLDLPSSIVDRLGKK
jgi:hypothetical protein